MNVQDTLAIRSNTHGDFEDNSMIMQSLKTTIRSFKRKDGTIGWHQLNHTQREALDMIANKIGRILSGNPNEPDHWHDIAGYATLVENTLRAKSE